MEAVDINTENIKQLSIDPEEKDVAISECEETGDNKDTTVAGKSTEPGERADVDSGNKEEGREEGSSHEVIMEKII